MKFLIIDVNYKKNLYKQECIPVGCIPSVAVAAATGGGGPCIPACTGWGVYPSMHCAAGGGVSAQGVSVPVHAGIHSLCEQNDRRL